MGCCLRDLFNIARSILVLLPSCFFSMRLVSVHVVHPYRSIDTTAGWKKLRFILSVGSDFHMTDRLARAVHAFANRCLCQLMRHCFLGRWIYQLVSESYCLVWRCRRFDYQPVHNNLSINLRLSVWTFQWIYQSISHRFYLSIYLS